uniref:GATA-type domain-containing protein n=2 Tax=Meloidogyne enterolobii TaxID=390850 RepID=A0A6V7VTT6_MELEN|nr:unnamed protein product [Meloidogyne enterolobii]
MRSIELEHDRNTFKVEIYDRSVFTASVQLKRRILIEIVNNEIIQRFLPEFEKQVIRYNNFVEKSNSYETSILEESLENITKKELSKENIENYKDKLLSSYWTEINLIGYKIELLEKQKVEYPKELKNRIIYIGSEIRGIIEGNKRNCFNCRFLNTIIQYRYLQEHYLCNTCHKYKIYNGKMRPEGCFYQTKMLITKDRKCFTCGATKTSKWHRHSKPEQYICTACYNKQLRIHKKKNKN